jgi:hypothetical protein
LWQDTTVPRLGELSSCPTGDSGYRLDASQLWREGLGNRDKETATDLKIIKRVNLNVLTRKKVISS